MLSNEQKKNRDITLEMEKLQKKVNFMEAQRTHETEMQKQLFSVVEDFLNCKLCKATIKNNE